MYLRIQKIKRDNEGRQFGTEIDVLTKVSRWSALRLLEQIFNEEKHNPPARKAKLIRPRIKGDGWKW